MNELKINIEYEGKDKVRIDYLLHVEWTQRLSRDAFERWAKQGKVKPQKINLKTLEKLQKELGIQ